MVLTVPFEGFAEALRAHSSVKVAYATTQGGRTVVTALDPSTGAVVRCQTPLAPPEAKAALGQAGIEVREGSWGDGSDIPQALWVAAVAYKSDEDTPGLWVDTYESKPTTGQVLAELYEEFRETGEVGDVSLEEFIRLADPNVVVLSPEEQAEFSRRSHGCD
jgi:hypothetical protein